MQILNHFNRYSCKFHATTFENQFVNASEMFELLNMIYKYVNCLNYKIDHSVFHIFVSDFPTAMRRLLRNEILLYRTASSVLHILPIAGLYTFLPKYLESQFQLSATKANMISGNYNSQYFRLGKANFSFS